MGSYAAGFLPSTVRISHCNVIFVSTEVGIFEQARGPEGLGRVGCFMFFLFFSGGKKGGAFGSVVFFFEVVGLIQFFSYLTISGLRWSGSNCWKI